MPNAILAARHLVHRLRVRSMRPDMSDAMNPCYYPEYAFRRRSHEAPVLGS